MNNLLHIGDNIANLLIPLHIFNNGFIPTFVYLSLYYYIYAKISYHFFLVSLLIIPSNIHLYIDLIIFSQFSIENLISNLSYNLILNGFDYKKMKEFTMITTRVYNVLFRQFDAIGNYWLNKRKLTEEQYKMLNEYTTINFDFVYNSVIDKISMIKSVKFITDDDKIEIDGIYSRINL